MSIVSKEFGMRKWIRCGGYALTVAMVFLTGCSTPAPSSLPEPYEVMEAPAPAPVVHRRHIPSTMLPRVMIMVDEQSLGTIPTAEVEAIGVKMLSEDGVPLVDQDMARANMAKGQQLFKSAGDNRAAASLGAQFGADVIIIGEAVAKPSARRIADTNLRTYQAVVTLRAVRTDSAETLCAASEDATAVELEDIRGSAKVLREAGNKAMEVLLPKMLKAWEPGAKKPSAFAYRIELSVGGVDAIWKLKAIRQGLRGMDGQTRNVSQRSYTAGLAQFSLEASLPSEELVEELVLNPPEGIRFQVLEVLPNQIQLKAVE